MSSSQIKTLHTSFLTVAKELTELAFKNAVDSVDRTYSKGAAIKNPQILVALVNMSNTVYTNIANDFQLTKTHGSDKSEIERLTTIIRSAEKSNDSLTRDVKDSDKQILEMQKELDNRGDELVKRGDSIELKNRQIKALREGLEKSEKDLKVLQEALKNSGGIVGAERDRASILKNKLDDTEVKLSNVENLLFNAQGELKKAKQKIEVEKKGSSNLVEKLSKAERVIEDLRNPKLVQEEISSLTKG